MFPAQGGAIRPKIPITLENPDTGITTARIFALVDTGADRCMMPKYIADSTGHQLKHPAAEKKVMTGIGGVGIDTWLHTFKISLWNPEQSAIAWTSPNQKIGCVEHDNVGPILGSSDFLKHFSVKVNYLTKEVVIEIP